MRSFSESKLPRPGRGEVVTLFAEPKLDTGYPDLVAVYWDRSIADRWPTARERLTADDVLNLHYLHRVGCVLVDDFRTRVGQRLAGSTLERLIAADVVTLRGASIRLRPLTQIFAITRLLAIEGKISNWRAGLQQAFANLWFASESFLLLPATPARPDLFTRARELGVGVVTQEQELGAPGVRARRERLPKSYASWLFNEWAWRGFGVSA